VNWASVWVTVMVSYLKTKHAVRQRGQSRRPVATIHRPKICAVLKSIGETPLPFWCCLVCGSVTFFVFIYQTAVSNIMQLAVLLLFVFLFVFPPCLCLRGASTHADMKIVTHRTQNSMVLSARCM